MHVRAESECAHLGVDPGVIIQAVSPEVDAQRVDGGVEITVTDYRHTETVMVQDGERGDPGTDGVSPTISVTDIPGGHRVTITDATGPHSFDVMDGEGAVESVNGQTGAVVLDAQDVGAYEKPASGIPASDLADGVIPEIPVQDVQVNRVSVLDAQGVANVPFIPNLASPFNIKNGTGTSVYLCSGYQHQAAFYGLAKAAGSDEKSSTLPVGQYTESAKSAISQMLNGSVSVSGTTPTITALPGIRYICGEVSTLDITLPASGIVDVVFESGSTATVLTITPPSGTTMKWANGFDPTALEANTTYEIRVRNGHLASAIMWA